MSGFASFSFVFGNFSTRFLPTSTTFKVAAAMSIIALLYMRVFLPESNNNICSKVTDTDFLVEKAAVVAFSINVAEVGLNASLMLIVVPLLKPLMGEEKMLSVGLFFGCAHFPYVAAMITVVATFALPCLRSIASKQTGPSEQGKTQGCITGICSFANIVSPLAFTPLTALFLSDDAPFHFPGFSIMVSGLAAMTTFVLSVTIRPTPSRAHYCISDQTEPLV
ncbi:Major facilitator superfamily protein [Striga hermonthica]|uniref:Major facilitator superfamily protein n=1 Tax=Striga hermonthica TaxID=68872 RepID=A0A9N7R5I0_STRHE|nr:Major facilitator superfamily protein [Striga hermonthica]